MPVLPFALLLPVALMLLMALMERVERPLVNDTMSEQLEGFLATARPDEVEAYVTEGYAPALEMYWRNRRRHVPSEQPPPADTTREVSPAFVAD
ncbi:MAG: hypothetical protein M3P04_06700 [Actinomycetota bacterium]|nr:hypothetical protein [Actinomycetota bacterium]